MSITSFDGKVPLEGLRTSHPRSRSGVLGAAFGTSSASPRAGRVGERPGAHAALRDTSFTVVVGVVGATFLGRVGG